MRHYTSPSFWTCYEKLPIPIKKLADKNFVLLKANPKHKSLHYKNVGKYWSVRIGKKYRALGVETEKGAIWFWIGTHAEYDRLIQ